MENARDAWGVFGVAVWLVEEELDAARAVPGPTLGARLEWTLEDLDSVPDEQLPLWTEAARRQANYGRAVLQQFIYRTGTRAMAQAAGFAERDDVAAHELAVPLHMSPRAAAHEFADSYDHVDRLPALTAAMAAGDLDERRARVFAEGTAELPQDLARAVVEALLERSFTMALPRLKGAIVKSALGLDSEYGERVYAAAVRRMDVTGRANADGTASITMRNVPPEMAAGVLGCTDEIAKAAKADGDPRPLGMLRTLILVCRGDGTFDGMDGDQIAAYLVSTRPDPNDPEADLPKARAHAPRRAGGTGRRRPPARPDRPVPGGESESGGPAGDGPEDDGPAGDGPEDDGPAGDGPEDGGGPEDDGPAGPSSGPAPAEPESEPRPDPEPRPATAEPAVSPQAGAPSADAASAATTSTQATSTQATSTQATSTQATSTDPATGPGGRVPEAFSRGAGVHLRVEPATLLGLNAHPGELTGWSPVGPTRATALAAEYAPGEWRWTATDADGYLHRAGTTRRRPHGHPRRDGACKAVVELLLPRPLLHRLLEPDAGGLPVDPDLLARWRPVLVDIAAGLAAAPPEPPDPTLRLPGPELRREVCQAVPFCVGPYCATPSRRTEIDHLFDHALGGPTVFINLGPMCKAAHRVKTLGAIRVQRPTPWRFTTTTPLGNTFTVTSPPLIDVLPDPRPGADPGPAPRRENPGYDWRTDDPWDTWISRPRPSRDWVAVKAAALRAKREARRRPSYWPPPPRPDQPDDDPPPF